MFLDNGVTQLTTALTGGSVNINYIAIGDIESPLALSDKTLSHEIFRKAVNTVISDGNSIYVEAFVNTNEANFNWKDIAIFANASMSPNSGQIIARATVNELKSDRKTVNITWEINIERK